MNEEKLLFALLRAQVCAGDSDINGQTVSAEVIEKLYTLSKEHDLAHIAGEALRKLGLLGDNEVSKAFKQASKQAVYRYMRTDAACQDICRVFEDAKIPFIPLKGSVLREFYPEPWMRTSCDVDIMVREEMLDAAADLLVERLNYVRKGLSDHDISMYAPSGLHVELHYLAVDEGRLPAAQTVLETIWSDASPKTAGSCHYCMSDEMFYFYHVAHMAKHFENGGCGIRPFLDLWILNNAVAHDRQKRTELLSRGGMLTFAQAVENLSEKWFSGKEGDALSDRLERYVLDGGVYGTLEGRIAVEQIRMGGKAKYVLSKIFLPYNTIKQHYPILVKHKWLTPVFQVVRWVKVLFKGVTIRAMRELKVNTDLPSEQSAATAKLLKQLGL